MNRNILGTFQKNPVKMFDKPHYIPLLLAHNNSAVFETPTAKGASPIPYSITGGILE
ncbi:hypothetical protein [Lentibacillus daqui]|uniref:hypothetical protein n=1 Tax=Lentibacillus daqui TaxID=2911514 RepID=UPI0022B1455F|nr:hypothetical protein [Lentibacillus daqui]